MNGCASPDKIVLRLKHMQDPGKCQVCSLPLSARNLCERKDNFSIGEVVAAGRIAQFS